MQIYLVKINSGERWSMVKVARAILLTHSGRDKMAAILQTLINAFVFLSERLCLLIQLSLKYAFKIQSNTDQALLQISALGKAIIWINDGLVYWCIYASLSFNELNDVIQCAAILSQVGLDARSSTFNSLAPEKFKWNFSWVIFNLILVTDSWDISCGIALGQHWFR